MKTLAIFDGIKVRFTIQTYRDRIIATRKLRFNRDTVGTGQILTRQYDVGQARVLIVQGYTEERRSRSRLARVVNAVVLRVFTTNVLQGTNSILFGQVFVIYYFSAGRVNDVRLSSRRGRLVVVVGLALVVVFRRISRFVAVVIAATTTSSDTNRYHDCQ